MSQLKRGDLPLITSNMLEILKRLRDAKDAGYPFIPLVMHGRTRNALFVVRDWIFESKGLDGIRYGITGRGLRALKVYEKAVRRSDGICPACGIRPKHVSRSGRRDGYCEECLKESSRKKYAFKGSMKNPDRLCPKCGVKKRHVTASGAVCTYCDDCRREERKAEKARRKARWIAMFEAGNPPMCKCGRGPYYRVGDHIHDLCEQCWKEYMNAYNDKRRGGAPKSRRKAVRS
jgi:hypothetical protein